MSHGPTRSETHRIDSLAVRRLFSAMNENWIVRDLSERDYGIDMMVEYWDLDRPTGKTAFFQIKGTRGLVEPLKSEPFVSFYDFKVKTLLYAEHFPEPFFLIYLSTKAGEPIYYLWLQKYIQLELDVHQPGWRKEDKVNLSIPVENNLLLTEERVLDIVSRNVLMKKSMRFLTDYYYWDQHIEELIENKNAKMKDICISLINKFKAYRSFLAETVESIGGVFEIEFEQAVPHIHSLDDTYFDEDTVDWLRNFREQVNGIVHQIMGKESVEEAVLEMTGDAPY